MLEVPFPELLCLIVHVGGLKDSFHIVVALIVHIVLRSLPLNHLVEIDIRVNKWRSVKDDADDFFLLFLRSISFAARETERWRVLPVLHVRQ